MALQIDIVELAHLAKGYIIVKPKLYMLEYLYTTSNIPIEAGMLQPTFIP